MHRAEPGTAQGVPLGEKKEALGAAERFGDCGVHLKREACCVQHAVFQIK